MNRSLLKFLKKHSTGMIFSQELMFTQLDLENYAKIS